MVVAVVALSRRVGSRFADRPTIPGSESERAASLVREKFPEMSGASARVVVKAKTETEPLDARPLLDDLRKLPHVIAVSEPIVSPLGKIAVADVRWDAAPADLPGAADLLKKTAKAHPEIDVAFAGELVSLQTRAATGPAEIGGLVAAIIVLLLVFGSVAAGSLPIAVALLAVSLGVTLIGALGTRAEISSIAPTLATMLGLGVGIDYALFLVTRFRQERAAGAEVHDAVVTTTATAGNAVVFAGLTVIVAMLGLALVGVPFVAWMGAAVSIVVAVAVAVAVTLLPALLRLMGAHIDRLRVPLAFRDDGEKWQRWSERVARRPVASLVFGLVALAALAAPVLGMRLGVLDDEMSSPDSTQHVAYTWLADGFGAGANGPLVVVVSPASAAKAAADRVATDPNVLAVLPAAANRDGSLALVTIIPTSAPSDEATSRLVHRLRKTVLPELAKTTGATFAVGGLIPLTIDLDEAVGARLPLVIGAVLVMSFVLLLAVFRAPIVSLKAVLLNLLSIGAAYGVVVLVFQHGVGLSLFGLAHPVPIVSFLPLLMFAVLFGLSMDYEVFMLTRVREEHAAGASSVESVSRGIAKTARVVTSAALVMVSVFVAFALGRDPLLKMFGVGLASAVALDASIVRLLLVPASMVLLGDRNWWTPFTRKSAPTPSLAREAASRSSG